MNVRGAQVLDLGPSYIHTKFHLLILGTSGGIKVYPSYTRWAHVYISNNFPCLTQFGKKLDLGPFYIQVLNSIQIKQCHKNTPRKHEQSCIKTT